MPNRGYSGRRLTFPWWNNPQFAESNWSNHIQATNLLKPTSWNNLNSPRISVSPIRFFWVEIIIHAGIVLTKRKCNYPFCSWTQPPACCPQDMACIDSEKPELPQCQTSDGQGKTHQVLTGNVVLWGSTLFTFNVDISWDTVAKGKNIKR